MQRPLLLLPLFLSAALAAHAPAGEPPASPNTLTPAERAAGWRLLFDGRTLRGWTIIGDPAAWVVEDGTIFCRGLRGGYLHTNDTFEDFILSAEYRVTPRANSGIFFRWSNLSDPVNTGIEMQIFDSHGTANPSKYDNGALYDIAAPAKNPTRPAGEWNRAAITCLGSRIAVEMNGEKVVEIDVDRWTEPGKNPDGSPNKFRHAYRDLPRRGYIGLQDHGNRVWFRNLKLRELRREGGASPRP